MTAPFVAPDPLPDWVLENHRRKAEVRVYNTLKEQLEAPWHVFYSRPWIGLDRDGRERDGEADFILAHPDLGILVLEVKGGRVEREAGTEKWFSTDAEGYRFSIHNPIEQAVSSKHQLLRKLRELPGWNGRFVTARHAVVFPSCMRPSSALGPDMPVWLFAGHDEMDRLGQWVEERMELHLPDESAPDALDDDGVAILREFLCRSFTLERPLGASLVTDDERIRWQTDQQAVILDCMDSVRRLAIPGPAGTGKTTLAVEKARRLAQDGERTLLTCYNRALATQLQRDVGEVPNLRIQSFHSLCIELAQAAGIDVGSPGDGRGSDFFRGRLPAALQEALRRLPERRYDAVVIDEGQDFPQTWTPAVEALLKDPGSGSLYVFYDDNQQIFGNAASVASNLPTAGLRLTRILRSGRNITETIGRLIPRPWKPGSVEGMPVEWIEADGALTHGRISEMLHQLIDDWHISPRHIAVLVPSEAYRDRLVRNERLDGIPVSNAEKPADNMVVCDSVRRFKGLERAAVVLVEPEDLIGEREPVYVGLTRARVLLVLLASAGRLKQIRTLLR